GIVSHPQANPSLVTITQLVHHETRFLRLIDEHAHLRRRDDNPHMKPGVRIRHRTDGLLVLPRVLGSQLLPCVGRMRDVLHSPLASCRVFSLKVERDRKSTRLNSSHVSISYAVFCLKKKMTKNHRS